MKQQLEAFKKSWLLFGGKPVLVELLEAIIDKVEKPLSEDQIDEIRSNITTPMDKTQFKEVRDEDGKFLYLALHDDYKSLLDRLAKMEKDINQLRGE